jgi:LEA14-like dessication related protein
MSGRAETGTVLFLIFAVALLVGVVFYQELTTPSQSADNSQVSISQFSVLGIKSIGFSNTKLQIQFSLDNPTPISATLESASYLLYGNGNYLGAGVISQHVKILAHGSTAINTDFDVILSGSSHVLWSYFLSDGDQISWEAKGNATLLEPVLGMTNIHFSVLQLWQELRHIPELPETPHSNYRSLNIFQRHD